MANVPKCLTNNRDDERFVDGEFSSRANVKGKRVRVQPKAVESRFLTDRVLHRLVENSDTDTT